jgi:ABC-type bacteriocin/lantibiotic exporter with double-glycine peptidase domain
VLLLQYKTLVGFKTLITASMLIVGSYLMINQQLTVGQFIAAEIVILTIISSVEKIIINLDSVYDILTAIEKIEQVIDKESEQQGSVQYSTTNQGMKVSLHDLEFSFPGSLTVLKDINITAAANEIICINGEEGAGKSTLLRLLASIYNDYKGNILLDDIPLRNYDLQSLRLRMGLMISQQDIFEGTLLENITMGLEPVNINEIKELSNKIGLAGFLATLKNGFDTKLSTFGRKLPGNVIKKILLLRAIINKPALVLLEEPWAGLDEQSQKQIKDFLLHEMKSSTIFIISNDAAFARECDKIITLKN